MPRKIRDQFSEAITNVDESQLRRTWEELEYRVYIRRVTNGAHIERLYIKLISFHIVLKFLHVCIFNNYETSLISYHPNHL
jgi:hypothetical protein